jgi:hypothetical protein
MSIIPTDRSRIECWEKCNRKRYWQYEYLGKGITKADSLKLDARIGTGVHNGIERGLLCVAHLLSEPPTIENLKQIALDAGAEFLTDCMKVIDWSQGTEQLKHDVVEGMHIVVASTYAWLRVKAPRLIADGEVLALEKELTVDFPVGADDVRLMARPDIVWRRKADGTIFIRNLKTVRKADDRWREKWALDMQTLSEPLAVDKWLSEPDDETQHDVCGGVIIDGLVTGEVLFDKYKQLYYHNNPLVYCWEGGDIGVVDNRVVDNPVFYPRYEWSCTEPHKFANGRKCPGGKSHKLSGVRKVSVAERFPGGILAWVDYLIDIDLALVEEMLIELPPIMRSEYQIERWKRQALPREVKIHNAAEMFTDGYYTSPDERLDLHFPMHTAEGNCLYPGKCQCYDLCHGTAAADPLNSGYVVRIPNHPEGEK